MPPVSALKTTIRSQLQWGRSRARTLALSVLMFSRLYLTRISHSSKRICGTDKLLLVYTLACLPGDLGTRERSKFVVEQCTEDAKEILRDVLGNKSARTVNKRANSLLALINWLHQREQFS